MNNRVQAILHTVPTVVVSDLIETYVAKHHHLTPPPPRLSFCAWRPLKWTAGRTGVSVACIPTVLVSSSSFWDTAASEIRWDRVETDPTHNKWPNTDPAGNRKLHGHVEIIQ